MCSVNQKTVAVIVGVLFLAVVGQRSWAGRLFVAESGINPQFANPTLSLGTGEQASLFIWAQLGARDGANAAEEIRGLALDVQTDVLGILEALDHDVATPILSGIGPRWSQANPGQLNVGDRLVTESNCVSIAVGLSGDHQELDPNLRSFDWVVSRFTLGHYELIGWHRQYLAVTRSVRYCSG